MRIGLVCLDPVMSDAIAALLSRTGGFEVVFNIGHLLKMVEIIESEMPDLVIFTEEFDAPDSRAHIRRMRESTDVPTMLLHAQHRQDLLCLEPSVAELRR